MPRACFTGESIEEGGHKVALRGRVYRVKTWDVYEQGVERPPFFERLQARKVRVITHVPPRVVGHLHIKAFPSKLLHNRCDVELRVKASVDRASLPLAHDGLVPGLETVLVRQPKVRFIESPSFQFEA